MSCPTILHSSLTSQDVTLTLALTMTTPILLHHHTPLRAMTSTSVTCNTFSLSLVSCVSALASSHALSNSLILEEETLLMSSTSIALAFYIEAAQAGISGRDLAV